MEVHRTGVTASEGMFPNHSVNKHFKEQGQLRLISNGPFVLSSTSVTQMQAKKSIA